MDKKKSKYLAHPSNDMLLSAKILQDINGLNTNRLGNNWLVGLGVALLCSIIFLNFANEKFPTRVTVFEIHTECLYLRLHAAYYSVRLLICE